MTQGYSMLSNPVKFVCASQNVSSEQSWSKQPAQSSSRLTGTEAKNFYENLLKTPSSHSASKTSPIKRHSNLLKKSQQKRDVKPPKNVLIKESLSLSTISKAPTCAELFKAAENGNLDVVKHILNSRVVDINAVDQFSWSTLMMAANKGHHDIVKYLLSQGAEWEDQADGSGYDAFDLACLSGHSHIAHMLRHWKAISKKEARQMAMKQAHRKVKREKLWCPACQLHYSATSDGNEPNNEHNRSISHQFCSRRKDGAMPQSSFYLSAHNKGYKMLQNSGWDGNSGLGPTASGRKYPIKTVLKRDRFGIGCHQATARVTHFGGGDLSAVSKPKKIKLKQAEVARDEKERNLAIDFRRSFYD